MADEKTLFNKNIDKNENSMAEDKQKHAIAREKDLEFVDFSLAFDGEEEDEELEEEYDEPRSVASLVKGFPLFKKKKDNRESFPTEENEVDVHFETKEKNEQKPQSEEEIEESIIEEENPKKEKKNKGFSLFAKKEKEFELPVEETPEIDEKSAKQAIQDEMVGEIIEIPEEPEETTEEIVILLDDFDETSEKTENVVEEEVILIEDFQEEAEVSKKDAVINLPIENETDEVTPLVEEQKSEKKKFTGFSFFNKKETLAQTEETVSETMPQESVVEEEAEAEETTEIGIFLSLEESAPVVENSVEEPMPVQEEQIEAVEFDVEETGKSDEEVFEEIPPFEATVEENVVENTTEEPTTQEPETKKKKKEKKQKPPKEKKKAKEKKKSVDEQNNESSVATMTMKDHLTFILIILALLLTIAFICVKFIPFGNNNTPSSGSDTKTGAKVSEIQLQCEGESGHLIQSDIENVFYVYSSKYNLAYYQYDDKGMISIQPTGTVDATVVLGQDKLPVKVQYIEMDGQLFGTGVFRAKGTEGNYLHSMVVFKLVNLPKGYEQDGKALLLATTNEEAVSQKCSVWTDSYIVDLATGKTTRFLTSDNNIFSTGYSILTDEGYASINGKIPFLTTREYDAVTNKKDIYLKDGRREALFATDVAGNFLCVDDNAVCYLKSTDDGFDVIRKDNGKENVIFSLRSDTSYMYYNEYLLDKYNGVLYNVKTGEKTTVSGYGMSNPEMMAVSGNGRYLVVLGTVNSAIDYQVHIFDLKSNKSAKYEDDNFSQHENLAFVDDTTIVYSTVDPSRGYEYVILDVSKAIK